MEEHTRNNSKNRAAICNRREKNHAPAQQIGLAAQFALLPLATLGITLVLNLAPAVTARIQKPLEYCAVLALILFIVVAVAAQWKTFLIALATVFPLVAAHNALGLSLGWGASTLWRLNTADRRAVTIEGGMQNSGLALGIIAAQFSSNIEMVSVAGLWGIWHLISGGTLAFFWRRASARSRRA